MEPLPCKEQKCILLPACVRRREITCEILIKWFYTEDTIYDMNTWKIVHRVLPNLTKVNPETKVDIRSTFSLEILPLKN